MLFHLSVYEFLFRKTPKDHVYFVNLDTFCDEDSLGTVVLFQWIAWKNNLCGVLSQ